jgi:ABC-type dipeptide/oligopeptide/nickel transport system ATPase component
MSTEVVIEIRDLHVGFPSSDNGWRDAVNGVSLALAAGERVGLVGESGSGKSLTALSCLGLVPSPGRITKGSISINGTDISTMSDAELRRLRGREIGLVMQEPTDALNPVYTAGFQLAETIAVHRGIRIKQACRNAIDLLSEAALGEPKSIARAYPHQLSGGEAQRVMLALALAGRPRALIADEPTSALDLLTQAQVIELLRRLIEERNMSLLLVSHDLEVAAGLVDRIMVMQGGRIVEEGSVREVFSTPRHAYTKMLLASAPGRLVGWPSDGSRQGDDDVNG